MARAATGWLEHLQIERGVAANTLTSYRRDLRRYLAFLAGRGLSQPAEVREGDVAEFLALLREGSAEHPPLSVS
ncbi:MAG: site-specific integrase, partial [Actinomycetota bacterium]|nr:site-specific integrase [Actinomycetota bacterium]